MWPFLSIFEKGWLEHCIRWKWFSNFSAKSRLLMEANYLRFQILFVNQLDGHNLRLYAKFQPWFENFETKLRNFPVVPPSSPIKIWGGHGVHELWSSKQTRRQTNKNYYLLCFLESVFGDPEKDRTINIKAGFNKILKLDFFKT